MLFILYALSIISFPILKRRRWNWVIYTLLVCFLVWTSAGTQTDYAGYNYIFESINSTGENLVGAGFAWFWLCRILGLTGLNYQGMILVLIIIACFLLHEFFLLFDLNENATWGMLLIFPLLINCIQVRFFFAMAIATYCLRFLIFDSKLSWLKYTVGIVLATSVHTGAVIYLVCILVLLYEKHGFKTNVAVTTIVALAVCASVAIIPRVAARFLRVAQYNRYIAESTSKSTTKYVLAIVVCWLITIILNKYVSSTQAWRRSRVYTNSKVYLRIFRITCLLGLTLPLLMFDRNFHRFIQMGYILDALCFGIYWKNAGYGIYGNNRNRKRLGMFVCFLLAMLPAIYSFTLTPVNALAPLFDIVGFPRIFE